MDKNYVIWLHGQVQQLELTAAAEEWNLELRRQVELARASLQFWTEMIQTKEMQG